MENEIWKWQYDLRSWETTKKYQQSEIRQLGSHKNKLAKLQPVFYSTKKNAFAFITTSD